MKWDLGLNFYSEKALLFNPIDINESENISSIEKDDYHIYVVGKKKKLFFESCVKANGYNITTLYYLDNNHEKKKREIKHNKNLFINSLDDGYYNINYKDQDNLAVRDFIIVAHLFSINNDVIGNSAQHPLPSDLEVIYIGQAFGRKKNRKIDYRIKKHEKIQEIALSALDSGSNEEILVIGLTIKTNDLTTSLVLNSQEIQSPTLENVNSLKDKASKRLTDGQTITFFEASLIRYFQPELNTQYKKSFPSPDFRSYDEIYNTDFTYSSFAINTRPIATRLYSKKVNKPKYIHDNHYPLDNKSAKKSLFEYLYDSNS